MPSPPLDPDQQRAVDHRQGPCLVLAGPGSGKTRVIVTRFLALVEQGVAPAQQLVLTYTRKAAAEMRDRAEAQHGPFAGEPPLGNYHSFAGRVVREWGWLAGIPPTYRLVDNAERWLHLEAVLGELTPRTLWNPLRPHDLIDPVLDVIGKAKQELVSPPAYAAWAARRLGECADPAERALLERHEEVAAVYAALDERFRRHAVLDHDDTILIAERLLREHAAPRQAIAGVIRHVMVDEYQDTNHAQARLVETLVESHRNLMVVADDDQAIYKFRGASMANLRRFERSYPEHERITLSRNYRSTAPIVAAATAVIGHADPGGRIGKVLTAQRGDGPPVELWTADDERSEAIGAAAECARLIAAGTAPGGIAWLFRTHAHMQPAIAACRELGVPYQVHGGRGFFVQPEIKDMLALLKAAADPLDSQSLLRCLLLPSWHVSNRGRMALVAACAATDRPLHAVLGMESVENLSPADREVVQGVLADIEHLHTLAAREDVRDLFHEALQRTGFLGVLETRSELARLQAGANLNRFGEILEAFADWSDDRSVGTTLRYLEVLRNSRRTDEIAAIDARDEGVNLLTAHGAKGLEWPVVFLSGCVGSRWPGRGTGARLSLPGDLVPEPAPPGDAGVDEERRLFYVALTRARDRLVLSRALRYPRSLRDESPSPFLQGLIAGDTVHRRELPAAAPLQPQRPRVPGAARPQRLDVSVSDVRVFNQCPRQFAYRRVYRLPVRTAVQEWYGTLMHTVLQNAAMRRGAGESIAGDDIAALWHASWEAGRGPRGSHAALRPLGEAQLRRYVSTAAWQREVVAVEESFSVPLTFADIAGRWDRLDRDGDGGLVVVDYKTGPPRDAVALTGDLQARTYALALARREAVDEVAVEMHHLQTAEVTRVRFDGALLTKVDRHLGAVTQRMATAWRDGDFVAAPSAWNCPRCPYRTVCDEGQGTAGGNGSS